MNYFSCLALVVAIATVSAFHDYHEHCDHHHDHHGNHGHHGHHGQHGIWGAYQTLSIMCAPESCIPEDVKSDIKSSWTDTGSKIWDYCLATQDGKCTSKNMGKIGQCALAKLINTTDITVKEARDTWSKYGFAGLEACCADTLTLRMFTCAETSKHFLGHHDKMVNSARWEHDGRRRHHMIDGLGHIDRKGYFLTAP